MDAWNDEWAQPVAPSSIGDSCSHGDSRCSMVTGRLEARAQLVQGSKESRRTFFQILSSPQNSRYNRGTLPPNKTNQMICRKHEGTPKKMSLKQIVGNSSGNSLYSEPTYTILCISHPLHSLRQSMVGYRLASGTYA